jgi:hypothetical protein
MPKRKIELPLETIDEILGLLGGFDALGKNAIRKAEKRGFEIPADVRNQIEKVSNAFKVFKKANDDVEIAELEELFALSFDEQTKS